MSAWRLVTNFAIPPALILTILLIIPTPQVVKKGLLLFTRNVLFFRVAGNFCLCHVMILLTGMALTACSIHTYKLSAAVLDELLTPNQKIGLLARKWREERNFWIALLAFLLWGNLNRIYSMLLEYTQVVARNKQLSEELAALKVVMGKQIVSQGVAAPAQEEPSAPPAPSPNEGLVNRGKKKDS